MCPLDSFSRTVHIGRPSEYRRISTASAVSNILDLLKRLQGGKLSTKSWETKNAEGEARDSGCFER